MNLVSKSQKCQVRLAGLSAKEPQKCSHVYPRLGDQAQPGPTLQQRKRDPDGRRGVCWLCPRAGSVTLGKPLHLSEPQLLGTGRETDNPDRPASKEGSESNLLSLLDAIKADSRALLNSELSVTWGL